MKKLQIICAGFVLGLIFNLHSQEAVTQDGAVSSADTAQPVDSLTDFQVALKALETVPPLPASEVPEETHGFYSAQNPDWPPLPADVLGLPIWPIGDGMFVLDDTNVNYVELQAESEEAAEAKAALQKITSLRSGEMSPMFSLISSPGGTPVYITNLVTAPDNNGNLTVTFSIAGGTNGFAYDIYATTNLAVSPIYSQWTWLGQGYTTNTYTFTNQSPDYTFYVLAIPQHTMVVAWGDDDSGQCDVPADLTNAVDVAAGYNFSVALKTDGTVTAWGDNTYGETNVPTGLTNVTAIAAGANHVLALLQNGTVVAWGENTSGQTNVPAGLTNVTAIAAGAGCSLALRNDGSVVAWGYNYFGQTNVPVTLGPVSQIAAGWVQSVVLLTNGTVTMWASNDFSSYIYNWNITNVPVGLSNVVSVAAGAYHTLAVKADGTVTAWGAGGTNAGLNNYGQSIVPAGLSNVVAVAGGYLYSLALQSAGTVVAWGDDYDGGTDVPDRLTGVKAISAGAFHGLAVRSGQLTPLILEEPGNQYAPAGGTVTFSSEGAGLYGVTYQWQFDGVNIAGATNSFLTLTNVQSANIGSYQVIISNSAGSVTSDAEPSTLIPPPQIISTAPAPGTNWIGIDNFLTSPPFANQTNISLGVTTATYAGQSELPLSYQWSFNGTNIPSATGATYSFSIFSYWPAAAPAEGTYTLTVSNAAGSTNVTWNIRVLISGMAAAWGDDAYGECDRPVTLTNVVALAAGLYCSAAVQDNGTVTQWGDYWSGGTNFVPVGSPPASSNVMAVASGIEHTIALKSDGTVIQWGLPGNIATNNFPTNLTGVKAVSAGWYRNLALLTNGGIVDWGYFAPIFGLNQRVPGDLTNATAIACGAYHYLAVRGDGTVECWGYDDSGQADVPAGLSNVVAVAGGGMHSLALKADGTVVAWGSDTYGQCNVPAGLSNVMAVAAGYFHSVALLNNGTVVSWGDNTYGETNVPGAATQIKLIAAGGYHTLASMFSWTVQYPVDVTKDLLLIYNTNSIGSTTVENYYIQNRPLVGGANVLGIGCPTNEIVNRVTFTNQVLTPYLNWLTNNPTKHPQYLVLFMDIPSRVEDDSADRYPSVPYQLLTDTPGIQPFVTSINMNGVNGTNDCIAYISKVTSIGTNYSPGKLIISASAGGYGNTNYYFDDTEINYGGYGAGLAGEEGVLANGAPSNSIVYTNVIPDCGSLACHITSGTNVAGYLSWGSHSSLGNDYATNGYVNWSGNSSWWIIETVESDNGQRLQDVSQGNFIQWYSSNAFGGTNYSKTPVGAVCNTEEPGCDCTINNEAVYFGEWAAGKTFALCAWNSRVTPNMQAVGDPFVTK